MRMLRLAALAALLAGTAAANDGFGGLSATGLQFEKTGAVAMVSEDLRIAMDQITVGYVFRNETAEDVTGEVIFPLPPISLSGIYESEFAIPREELDKENIVGFTATVDGKAVEVKTDRIAVLPTPSEEEKPASAEYSDPGKDVTERLTALGIPLSLSMEKVSAALNALSDADKKALESEGLVFLIEGEPPGPLWSLIERYHWTQTFPAGKEVAISHWYRAAYPGGVFIWKEKPTEDDSWQAHLTEKYCIDGGTAKAIMKALEPQGEPGEGYFGGMAYQVDYVLTTANTWKGPIGKFKLTIAKGDEKSVISLCVDGIRKTGPTTFVVEKKDFTPESDISILVVPDVSTLQR